MNSAMTSDTAALYNAYASRDPRFDGVFYIGVTSTGIYCRPVCAARTAKLANCRFFTSADTAEKASFRPCLRCRPELAPGNAPVDDAQRIATLLAHRVDEGCSTMAQECCNSHIAHLTTGQARCDSSVHER
jgi:AraC family transcriptional regulator of adaptative response / DNA-3-methyladenine glycosylase II